jgi:glycosyltransferase involved in cell wall biosynthesis
MGKVPVSQSTVTVCVPVYRAAEFVGETLSHIAAQTYNDLRVLVSVDLSDDGSLEACHRFTSDSRFEVIAQTQKLGWIGNINSLIGRVETEDYCLIPHDDLIGPDYIVTLRQTLDRLPNAAIAYTDIEGFGALSGWTRQKSISGGLFDRVMSFLTEHFDAIAFRGLVRRSRAGPDLLLRKSPFDSYAADTLWMFQVLRHGGMVRVRSEPNHGYRKRYRVGSKHHDWLKWNGQRRIAAWVEHCAQCAEYALALPFSEEQRALIVEASLLRGVKRFKNMGWPPYYESLAEPHQALIMGLLATRIAGLPLREGAISRLRSLRQYARMTAQIWGEPDTSDLASEYKTRVIAPPDLD